MILFKHATLTSLQVHQYLVQSQYVQIMLWHLRRDHKVVLLRTFHVVTSWFTKLVGLEMRFNACCIKNHRQHGGKHVGHVLSSHRSVLGSVGK